eukprot:320237-Chlamydomonas_euryale.AAC.1
MPGRAMPCGDSNERNEPPLAQLVAVCGPAPCAHDASLPPQSSLKPPPPPPPSASAMLRRANGLTAAHQGDARLVAILRIGLPGEEKTRKEEGKREHEVQGGLKRSGKAGRQADRQAGEQAGRQADWQTGG